MKKIGNLIAVGLCAVLAVMGCSNTKQETKGNNKAETNNTKAEVNEHQGNLDVIQPMAYGNVEGLKLEPGTSISLIGRGSSSAYWTEVKEGAQKAVDDINAMLGYKGEDKIKLTYSAPATEEDVDDQVNILDEELARYPAAVGIAAVDSSACEVQFDLAAENNIPVVAFDSGTNYQDIVCMVDTNNVEAAATAANKLCDSIGDEGEILLFVHDSKSTTGIEREEGFVKTIQEKHPGVTIGAIYHLDDLQEMQKQIAAEKNPEAAEKIEETPETENEEALGSDITQEEVVDYILEKHPDAKGIYTTSEAVAKLVVGEFEKQKETDDKEKSVKIVSFDGGKDQLELLNEGKLEGLIVQNPYGIGYATVVACSRAILGQGNEAEVDTGYVWVTKDNIDDETISRMMY